MTDKRAPGRDKPAKPAGDHEPITVEVPGIRVETYSMRFPNGERWIFNVTRARNVVRMHDHRELYSLSTDQLVQLLDGKALNQHDVDTADPKVPGIGAVIPYGGQRTLELIDGLARAARAYMTDSSFPIYVLTDAERDLCLWSKDGLQGIKDKVDKGELPLGETDREPTP
jgi:hypothetical protein